MTEEGIRANRFSTISVAYSEGRCLKKAQAFGYELGTRWSKWVPHGQVSMG